jgi:hypothetical protein
LFICNPQQTPQRDTVHHDACFLCVACPFTFTQLCNHQQHTYGRSCSRIYN